MRQEMDPNGHQPGIVKLLGLWTLFDEQIRAQREKRNQISFEDRHLKWGKTELAYYEAHVCRRRGIKTPSLPFGFYIDRNK